MIIDISTQIVINKAVEDVSAFVSNPDTAPLWYTHVQSSGQLNNEIFDKGTQFFFKLKYLGIRMTFVYQVIEFIPNQKLVMRTIKGPLVVETTYTWTREVNNFTRMTVRNHGHARGLMRLVSPLLPGIIYRGNTKDMENVKFLLESPASE